MAYINCGKWNKNYKYILFTVIFAFFTNCFFGFVYNDKMDIFQFYKGTEDTLQKLSYHAIFHYIIRFIVLLLFSLCFYKTERNNYQNLLKKNISLKEKGEESLPIKLIYNNAQEDLIITKTISPIIMIFIITIMVLQGILEEIFYKSNLRELDFWMFELLLLSYLNKIFFNYKFYKHHNFAIVINVFICFIYKIISLFFLIWKKDDFKSVYLEYKNHKILIPLGIILYLIGMISRAYAITYIKILMDINYFSPNKLLIIYGIIGTLISIIVGIISTFINCPNFGPDINMNICKISNKEEIYFENLYLYWKTLINYKKEMIIELCFLISGVVTNFFYNYFFILIIKYLTPVHIIFANLIYSFFLRLFAYIYNFLFNKEKEREEEENFIIKFLSYIDIIIQILVTFGILVYLEIIVLNFCNLNYNLRQSIIGRSIKDYELGNIGIKEEEKEDDENLSRKNTLTDEENNN